MPKGSKKITPEAVRAFQEKIWNYYLKGKRAMPWRNIRDGYRILVSEIMLQQTQVGRVVPKYEAFIKRFPDAAALAAAPQADVLALWQGLGYNRRALSLQRAAKELVERFGGEVPRTLEELDSLPGVGAATAAAVYTYAFNLPAPFIETNIRTVYIHEFFPRSPKVSDQRIAELVATTLDARNPREWFYALMDYGAHVKAEVGNLSRKSSVYAKQSAFAGSLRQLRGAILRKLVQEGEVAEAALALYFKDDDRFADALAALVSEGFLRQENGRILIPR
jgi:A/G-specific adenine glycosylase